MKRSCTSLFIPFHFGFVSSRIRVKFFFVIVITIELKFTLTLCHVQEASCSTVSRVTCSTWQRLRSCSQPTPDTYQQLVQHWIAEAAESRPHSFRPLHRNRCSLTSCTIDWMHLKTESSNLFISKCFHIVSKFQNDSSYCQSNIINNNALYSMCCLSGGLHPWEQPERPVLHGRFWY